MEQASDLLAQARAMAAAGRWDQALSLLIRRASVRPVLVLRTLRWQAASPSVECLGAARTRWGEEKEWAERFGAYLVFAPGWPLA